MPNREKTSGDRYSAERPWRRRARTWAAGAAYLTIVSPLCWGGGVYLDRLGEMPLVGVALRLAGTPAEVAAFATAPDAARAFSRGCVAIADAVSD